MSYTDAMRESIKKVEATRNKRLEETRARLTPEEKELLLKDFHPDYREDTMRELKIGPNVGDRMPHEVVDILESRSRLHVGELELTADKEVDVLVIGAGGAGSSAALKAQEAGADVLLTTKLRLGDANTMMAQGGIQIADKENDSPAIHYLDVMGGGGFLNKPQLVSALVMDAPYVGKWLEELGCMFDKDENGRMMTKHGGGTSRKRMHSALDYTGAEIMRTLRDELLNRQLPYLEFTPAVELLLDDNGRVTGAVLYNMEVQEYIIVRAKTVILATGGFGRIHVSNFPTTNHYGATADGLVMAYRSGANLLFLDATQFHPTGAAYPEQIVGLLITEKVRGLGAQLVNREGNQFIYSLETRDAASSGIIRECTANHLGVTTPTGMKGVWLDAPIIDLLHGKGTILKDLPAMYRQYDRFNIDITRDPILIYPTLHYQNGGIEIDENGETQVENLFVAGEAAGGIHGRNRLMGNSLLDIIVFGLRAGKAAAERSKAVTDGALTLAHVEQYHRNLKEKDLLGDRVSPILLPDYTREKAQ